MDPSLLAENQRLRAENDRLRREVERLAADHLERGYPGVGGQDVGLLRVDLQEREDPVLGSGRDAVVGEEVGTGGVLRLMGERREWLKVWALVGTWAVLLLLAAWYPDMTVGGRLLSVGCVTLALLLALLWLEWSRLDGPKR